MSENKHSRVFEELLGDIKTGRYKPGQKFPSEATLVKRFSASRITVGRAVNDLQKAGWVERFAGSGTYVSGGSRAGMLFGLIIPDLGSTEIFEPICQGIANAPDAEGHALLWPQGSDDAVELGRKCVERGVTGAFFAPVEADDRGMNRKVMAELKKAGIPVVLLDRRADPNDRRDLVSVDNYRAGWLAAEHLKKLGALRIGFLAYRGLASSVQGRIAGYRAVVPEGQVFEVQPKFELPADALACDAFVCANDRVAGHLMFKLLAAGRRIPQDVRIVGIDDVNYAALLPVPLTTIHQPCREIGEAALRTMLQRLAHPKMPAQELLLDCELVIRESCGAISNTR
jgi:GntR family transcriptional regulator of arabinose operon